MEKLRFQNSLSLLESCWSYTMEPIFIQSIFWPTSHLIIMLLLWFHCPTTVHLPGGPQSFTITGELKHLSGSLLPEPGQTPIYAQVYFQSNEEALDLRIRGALQVPDGNGSKRAVIAIIQDVLLAHNHYVALYKLPERELMKLETFLMFMFFF